MEIESFIDALNARTPKLEDNDFLGEDGLFHCFKCGTPKQCRIRFAGKEKIVGCLCQCAEENLKLERKFQQDLDHTVKVSFLLSDCFRFASKKMHECEFKSDDRSNQKVSDAMQKYADNFEDFLKKGKGLILYGNIGSGKSFYAAAIANQLIKQKEVPVLMTNFAEIANILQESFDRKAEFLERLNHYKLLILDDLGAERNTEYMNEIIFQVIDSRYRSGLPMIITTNMTIDQLKKPDRILDRIMERCFPVEVAGKSHRRKNLTDDFEETKKMLGL